MGAKRTYEKQLTITIAADDCASMSLVKWALSKNVGLIPVKYTNELTKEVEWQVFTDYTVGKGIVTKYGVLGYHGYWSDYDNSSAKAFGFRRVKRYHKWDTEKGEFYRVTLGRDIMAIED